MQAESKDVSAHGNYPSWVHNGPVGDHRFSFKGGITKGSTPFEDRWEEFEQFAAWSAKNNPQGKQEDKPKKEKKDKKDGGKKKKK